MVPATPFEIAPETPSIVAPSPGAGLKVNVPPAVPVTAAEFAAPKQKSVSVNDGSSNGSTVTVTVAVFIHPFTSVPVTV